MKRQLFFGLTLMSLVAAGCGGGGGTGASGQGQAASVPVYATDAPSNNFKNVWVTIDAVKLVSASGTVTAFTSTPGVVVDVRSLRDTAGQLFEFLDAAGVPAGTYTGAQVFVDNTVTIVPTGSTSSTSYQFSTANSGGQGETLLTTTFGKSFTASASNPIVLDFNLDNWSINTQNQVVASVNLAFGANVNASGRQVNRPLEGSIQNLSGTSGSQTFDLVSGGAGVLQVTTDANTTIANSDGSASPSLANAEPVFVQGMIVNGVFTASEVTILNGQANSGKAHVEGTFSNVDASAGTFTLTEQSCNQALTSTTLTVDTTSTTVFASDGVTESQSDFFGQLSKYPNANVEVTGTLNGSTLTATNVEIDVPQGSSGQPHLVAVLGAASAESTSAGTFTLTANMWLGGDLSKGESLNVVTNSSTLYNLTAQT